MMKYSTSSRGEKCSIYGKMLSENTASSRINFCGMHAGEGEVRGCRVYKENL
jgi:hypothetical protein